NFVVTVDTHTAMTITGLQDDTGTVTGLVADGGLTDDAAPVLTGTAEPGSTVYIESTGAVGEPYSFTVTAGVDGKWSLPQTFGAYGTFSYSAYSVDAAGNKSAAATFHVEYVAPEHDDTTAPGAPVITQVIDDVGGTSYIQAGGTTDDNTPTIAGTAEAGSLVNIFDNGALIGTAVAQSNGIWSFDSPVRTDGMHNFTATATDAAGNISGESGSFVVNISALQPSTGVESFEQVVHPDTISDSFTTDSGLTVQILAGDSLNWRDYSGANHNLMDDTGGTHFLDVGEKGIPTDDDLGSVKISLPGTATSASIALVRSESGEPNIIAYDAQGNPVHVTLTQVDYAAEETFIPMSKYVITADAGQHIASFTVEDIYYLDTITWGNADVLPPAAPTIDSVYDDIGSSQSFIANGATTDDTAPTLSGHAEAGSLVNIYDNNVHIGTAIANSNGQWSLISPLRSEGSHIFTATATDAAGNISKYSGDFAVNIDVPDNFEFAITGVIDNYGPHKGNLLDNYPATNIPTDDVTPTLTGTSEAGSLIRVYTSQIVDGASDAVTHLGYFLGETTADSSGYWTFTTPVLPYVAGGRESIPLMVYSTSPSGDESSGIVIVATTPYDQVLHSSLDVSEHSETLTLAQIDDSHTLPAAVDMTDHAHNTLQLTLN
ncbi:Ig-like domain-containing protein, partial [Scandinavium sp. M-37]|uniref:Ig-like domain-containing protein n=1 Tax=Scandinavium sp. M-37 TaxID=3373077 RepID=UPI003746BF18